MNESDGIFRRVNYFIKNINPKQLFLIDGFGAIFSAILLGVVLVRLEPIFGIPESALYLLTIIPCFFAAYDFYCYFQVEKKIDTFLKGIAIMNGMYCIISIVTTFFHRKTISIYGWVYIILEIIIACSLAVFEFKIANKI